MSDDFHSLILKFRVKQSAYLKSVEGSVPCQPISFQSSDLRGGSALLGKANLHNCLRASWNNVYELLMSHLDTTKHASNIYREVLVSKKTKHTLGNRRKSYRYDYLINHLTGNNHTEKKQKCLRF